MTRERRDARTMAAARREGRYRWKEYSAEGEAGGEVGSGERGISRGTTVEEGKQAGWPPLS
jgi:hypothetical protein